MQVINFLAEKYYKIAYDTFFYIEDNKKAHKYIEYALEVSPNHIKTLKLKGRMLILEDRITEALYIWDKLYNMGEKDFETTSKLAYCYAQKGEYLRALEFCEKSAMCVDLGENEKMFSLYRLKIEILLGAKKPASAFKLFKNALKMLGSTYAYELKNSYSFLAFYNDSVISLKNVKRAF